VRPRLPSPGLLDPRNGPAHDLPTPGSPPRTYVIASTPRSGSTLLCRLLWATGRAGAPKEYLNPMQLRDWELRLGIRRRDRWAAGTLRGPLVGAAMGRLRWGPDRIAAHLERVRSRRSSGGWFGLKLHHHHRLRWFPDGRLPELLGTVRWIRIHRADRRRQAVSWARAEQTGQWASWQRPLLPPIYSRRQIDARWADLDAAERGWDQMLEGQQSLQVCYADLVADPVGETRRVLGWLGVPDADSTPVPPPALTRQSDGLSERWVQRHAAADPRRDR